MPEPTHDEQVAQAELVNKFIKEVTQKMPRSPLKHDLAPCFKLPAGAERNAKTLEVLKKYGYEDISLEKLEEIMNPRPVDPSKIVPPEKLTDKKDPTKADADWSLFAGAYKITSEYHPATFYRIAFGLDGTASWGTNGENSHQAKFETAVREKDGKVYNEYWAVWGDKKAEWWAVQFFGPSDTVASNTFIGYHYPGNGVKEEKFTGTYIKETRPGDDSDFWLDLTRIGASVLSVLLIVGGIYCYKRRQNAQAAHLQAEIDRVDHWENRDAPEVEPRMKRDAKVDLEKVVEGLIKKSEVAHDKLIEAFEKGVSAVIETELAENQESDRRLKDVGEPLRSVVQDRIQEFKVKTINDMMGALLEHDAKLLEQEYKHPDIQKTHILEATKGAINKACEFKEGSFRGPLGHIVEQAIIIRDKSVLNDKFTEVHRAAADFMVEARAHAIAFGQEGVFTTLSGRRAAIDNIRQLWFQTRDAREKKVHEEEYKRQENAYKEEVKVLEEARGEFVKEVYKSLQNMSEKWQQVEVLRERRRDDPKKIEENRAAEGAKEALKKFRFR